VKGAYASRQAEISRSSGGRDRCLAVGLPGAKLPTYDALMEQLPSKRADSWRAALTRFVRKAWYASKAHRSISLQTLSFRHHNRYLWVTSEQPGSLEWVALMATFLDPDRGCARPHWGQEVVPLVVWTARQEPALPTAREVVEQRASAAGILRMTLHHRLPAPALEKPGRRGAANSGRRCSTLGGQPGLRRADRTSVYAAMAEGKRWGSMSPHEAH